MRESQLLDVCPSSNVGLALYPSLEAHPVAAFWRAGVNMTISSDDPAFLHTTLTDELRHVVRLAGLSRDDLAELQRRAARHSFASPEVKAGLLGEIEAWVAGG
jgi:adenosine deaminase